MHPAVHKTHNRELILSPNTILVYDVLEAGDGVAVGYVGIRDVNETYHFFDKVFFRASYLEITKDFELNNIPNKSKSTCGYIDVKLVGTDFKNLPTTKPKKVISLAEKKRRDFLKNLTKEEMDIYRMYYKMRVKKMERNQGTCVLESSLLDQIEYLKSKIGKKFHLKNFIKGHSKKFNFRSDKLYSGYQKRIACKRWAKKDFLENDRKFNDLSLPLYKGLIL